VKRLINDPKNVVQELFTGFVAMHHPKYSFVGDAKNIVVKSELPEDRVMLLIGGGSGHEPLFIEFIGEGFADGVCQGNVFAAPSPDTILTATKALDKGKGVLYVYGNYAGDNMNFDMAAELAEMEGIQTATVRVWDDVASAPPDAVNERRGIAGDLFVIKVAGAACDSGLELSEVHRITAKARDNTRTMGVALAPGYIPGETKATFELGPDEMEIGMGLHGEPGVRRGKLKPADEVVDEIIDLLIADLPFAAGDEVCLLVNGYGATTRMELLICVGRALETLKEKGIKVYHSLIGNYATCQEMAGVSLTMMRLDDELKKYYDYPGTCPALCQLCQR
jgi:dihydroxyacetone kinase-like protein